MGGGTRPHAVRGLCNTFPIHSPAFWREEKSSRHLQDFFEVFEPWCSPEPSLLLHLMFFCSTVQKSDHGILLVPSLKELPLPTTSLFLPPKTLHLKGWKMLQPDYHQDHLIYLDIKRAAGTNRQHSAADLQVATVISSTALGTGLLLQTHQQHTKKINR